jgi:rod shape-determining protein MreD
MLIDYLKYIGIAIILFLIQKTFIPLISIQMITPDLPILLVIYIGVRRGQITGLIFGFLFGLLIDIFSSTFLGLSALSYLIAGFIAGYFYDENRPKEILQSYFYIFVMFLVIIISNLIYYTIFIQGNNDLPYGYLLLKFVLGSSLYTLIFGVIFMFTLSKRIVKSVNEV